MSKSAWTTWAQLAANLATVIAMLLTAFTISEASRRYEAAADREDHRAVSEALLAFKEQERMSLLSGNLVRQGLTSDHQKSLSQNHLFSMALLTQQLLLMPEASISGQVQDAVVFMAKNNRSGHLHALEAGMIDDRYLTFICDRVTSEWEKDTPEDRVIEAYRSACRRLGDR